MNICPVAITTTTKVGYCNLTMYLYENISNTYMSIILNCTEDSTITRQLMYHTLKINHD